MSDLRTPSFHSRSTPKVAFYTYPEWAFGSIHEALCRELYKHGILAHIIDWNRAYSHADLASFAELYDVFVTVPGNAVSLLNSIFRVPNEKIMAIAHGRYDLEYGIKEGNNFGELKKFGVIGKGLAKYAEILGIQRTPSVLRNGIHFDMFYQEPPDRLSTLGYAGVVSYKSFDQTREIKRGFLAEKVSQLTNTPLRLVEPRHFLTMPSFYRTVDCTLLTSTEESWGLPMVESAASGRLPIGTKVGVLNEFENLGIALPIPGEDFMREASEVIHRMKSDHIWFHRQCLQSQDFVRETLDWSVVVSDWLNFIL